MDKRNAEKLGRTVQRKLIKRMLVPFILLAISFLYLFWLYSEGLLTTEGYTHPYDIRGSLSRLNAIAQSRSRELFSVSITTLEQDIIDTGIQMTYDDMPFGNYLAVYIQGKYVLCFLRTQEYHQVLTGGSHTFVGTLRRLDLNVAKILVDGMMEEGIRKNAAANMIYSYYIEPEDPIYAGRTAAYFIFFLILGCVLLVFIKRLIPILDLKHYLYMKKLPDIRSIQDTFTVIERQHSSCPPEMHLRLASGNSVCLTQNWIIHETPWSFRFYLADDLLLAYKATRTTKVSGLATTGERCIVRLFVKGDIIKVSGKEQKLNMLLSMLSQAYPWALIGYSPDREGTWYSDIKKLVDNARYKKTKIGHQDFGSISDC